MLTLSLPCSTSKKGKAGRKGHGCEVSCHLEPMTSVTLRMWLLTAKASPLQLSLRLLNQMLLFFLISQKKNIC